MEKYRSEFPSHHWVGRDDGPGIEHARWHGEIGEVSEQPGVVLVGFASDEGVRRNNGRIGARKGPAAIRKALASLAVHKQVKLYDAGDITVYGEDLESGHATLTSTVGELLSAGNLVIALGGGHETSFGTHRGLREATNSTPVIVNLDAHFDLREAEKASSGTPFKQIAELYGDDFFYSVVGISPSNNTRALFKTAESLGVHVLTDNDLIELSPSSGVDLVLDWVAGFEHIHLSIDLDVLSAGIAPGVSAPAALGVGLGHVQAIVKALSATGRLRLIDVVELNPDFDIDERTAKVAARLINEAVSSYQTISAV